MVTIIPKRVKNIWDVWNVRGAIIFSFLIQMILVLFAPSRKRSDTMLLQFFIWTAYLLADWAANFSMGLITNDTGGGGDDDGNKEILRALWAPFVLLHFGGPDTITALTLEDNQLWLRQVPGLLFQVGASAYVFVLSLPRNTMWVPTILVFIAGLIKCFERTRALYIASNTLARMGNNSPFESLLNGTSIEPVPVDYFTHLKPSASKLRFLYRLLYDSLPYYDFRREEILLEYIYEMHYTKVPVLRSRMGSLLRIVAFSSMVVALGVFSSVKKTRGSVMWDNVDVTITYTLFCGALLIEIVSCLTVSLRLLFILMRIKSDTGSGYRKFSTLFRPWTRSISGHNLMRLYISKCHDQPKTPYLYWKLMKFIERTFDQTAYSLGVKEFLKLSKYKRKTPLDFELCQFIFRSSRTSNFTIGSNITLKERIDSVGGEIKKGIRYVMYPITYPFSNNEEYPFGKTLTLLHIATTLCDAADEDDNFACNWRRYSKLISDYMMYLFLMQPDMMSELHGIEGPWAQENLVDGSISREFIEFFKKQKDLTSRDHEEKAYCRYVLQKVEACQYALRSPLDDDFATPIPTVLVLARSVAFNLQSFCSKDFRWEVIANIWVQMLIFAAMHCRPSIHVKHLPKGGELISLVWLASSWENVVLRRLSADTDYDSPEI